ncbi:MAG: ABC transporter substrate-binding protein [Romboutsia sp.]|nr:ABC transporter substrate-binding protein [Romboutsia sp.]
MKKRISLILTMVLVVMLAMVGCSSKETTIKDREGKDVKVPDKIDRIISAVPSNTEILMGLGLKDKLVGVDTYSQDIPNLPKDIEIIDFYNPDAEAIIGLQPDIVLASSHNKTGTGDDPLKIIEDAGISVFYIPNSESIESIYDDINFIAGITNTKAKGQEIVNNMKAEINKIAEIGKTITDKKKVYFEIGPAPTLYSFGHSTFLNEMIELVGAENIFKDINGWTSPSEEAVIDANPDVILTNVNYVENSIEEIKSRKGWENIKAIKDNQVYMIDKNASSRPSQHIVTALKQIANAIYPEYYGQK